MDASAITADAPHIAQHRLAYSPEEAAYRLGIGRSTLFGLLASGDLDSIRVGRRRLVPDEALRRFIADRMAGRR